MYVRRPLGLSPFSTTLVHGVGYGACRELGMGVSSLG